MSLDLFFSMTDILCVSRIYRCEYFINSFKLKKNNALEFFLNLIEGHLDLKEEAKFVAHG